MLCVVCLNPLKSSHWHLRPWRWVCQHCGLDTTRGELRTHEAACPKAGGLSRTSTHTLYTQIGA